MHRIKLYSTAYFLLLMFALSGCPEENDHLVNPPSQSETVNVRFINLAGDYQSRSLRMTEDISAEIPFAQSTETYHPPDDSTKATVMKNGRDEYSPKKQIKFFRKLTYSFFALPTSPSDSLHPLAVDTLMGINTSLTIPDITNDGFVRLVNCYSDTNTSFTLIKGCAGGVVLAPNLQYRGVSSSVPILSGENTFSVLYNHEGQSESLGLFRLDMVQRGEYAFVVIKNQSGTPEVYTLDEKGSSSSAFSPGQKVEAKLTNIRTVNFSKRQLDISLDNEVVASSPKQNFISPFEQVTACSGTTISMIAALNGSDTLSTISASLEVLKDYTLYLFDEGDKVRQILAPPFKVFDNSEGKSILRVVNGNPDYDGITISFGARKVTTNGIDALTSGETIARNVKYGSTSAVGVFASGFSPITVFASTQPAKYVTGVNFDLKPNKSYTMVLYKEADGSAGFTIIEDKDENIDVNRIEPGVFAQIVNGVAGPQSVRIGIEPLISESFGEISYSLNFATVLPIGQTNITVNGKSKSINLEKGKRLLIVANGTENNESILAFQYDPIEKFDNRYRVRYLNASSEINKITFSRYNLVDCPTCSSLISDLNYGDISPIQDVYSEAKISIFIYNPDDYAKLYHRVDDLKLNYNKAYVMIFAGNSSLGNNSDNDNTNNGYTVIQIQEY